MCLFSTVFQLNYARMITLRFEYHSPDLEGTQNKNKDQFSIFFKSFR